MDNQVSLSENSTSVLVCLDKEKLLQHLQKRIQAASLVLAQADDRGNLLSLKESFTKLLICRDLQERIGKGEFDSVNKLPSPPDQATD